MFIRLIALVALPVLAFVFWQDILTVVPEGYSRVWLPVFAAVLFGFLMMVFGLRPRAGSKAAVLDQILADNRKVMQTLSNTVTERLSAMQEEVTQIRDTQARTGKSLISIDQLAALKAFDPSINTKVPQLMALADALGKVEMPDVDIDRLEALVGIAQHVNKLDALGQMLDDVDFGKMADVVAKASTLLDSVQKLSVDGEGDHRDYDDIKRIMAGVADALERLKPMLAALQGLDTSGAQISNVVFERIDGILDNVGSLANDGENDPRDFGDLKTLLDDVGQVLQATADLVKPENGLSPTLVKDVKTVGEIVRAVEGIVLDQDNDPIDFSDTTDAVKSLDEMTSTVFPLVSRMRQTG